MGERCHVAGVEGTGALMCVHVTEAGGGGVGRGLYLDLEGRRAAGPSSVEHMAEKPTLYLTNDFSAEGLAAMFCALTGRELTPQEVEEMRAVMAAAEEADKK